VASDIYQPKSNTRGPAAERLLAAYQKEYRASIEQPEQYWAERAKILDWFHPWHNVLDEDRERSTSPGSRGPA
jgi:acetyl-CoA synthetase